MGFVLIASAAIKFAQSRRKARAIMPKGGKRKKMMPDVESGLGAMAGGHGNGPYKCLGNGQ